LAQDAGNGRIDFPISHEPHRAGHVMLNVTLRQLRIFQAAAADMSFVRAAKRLHLTPPAISMQIRHLEEALGFSLFERNGRRVALSDAGRAIFQCSLNVSGHFAELESIAEQFKSADRGHIDIAALTTADYLLPELLTRFLAGRPDVAVTLKSGNGATVMRHLEGNLVDFAIVGAPDSRADIIMEPLFDNAFVVVASARYLAHPGGALPIELLGREPLIVREAASSGRIAIESFLAKHALKPVVRMSLASDEAIKNAVRAGAGIAVLPLVAVQLELAGRQLRVLRVQHFPLIRPWHLAVRKGKKLSLAAESLRTFLRKEAPKISRELLARPDIGGGNARGRRSGATRSQR
jgi:DNA-binding transcriptional LysR family regulator